MILNNNGGYQNAALFHCFKAISSTIVLLYWSLTLKTKSCCCCFCSCFFLFLFIIFFDVFIFVLLCLLCFNMFCFLFCLLEKSCYIGPLFLAFILSLDWTLLDIYCCLLSIALFVLYFRCFIIIVVLFLVIHHYFFYIRLQVGCCLVFLVLCFVLVLVLSCLFSLPWFGCFNFLVSYYSLLFPLFQFFCCYWKKFSNPSICCPYFWS